MCSKPLILLHRRGFATSVLTPFRWRTSESNDFAPYSHHPDAYALSNPILFTDPSGRCIDERIPWIGEPGCRIEEGILKGNVDVEGFKQYSADVVQGIGLPGAMVADAINGTNETQRILNDGGVGTKLGIAFTTVAIAGGADKVIAAGAQRAAAWWAVRTAGTAAGGIVAAACADGDCTNEANNLIPEVRIVGFRGVGFKDPLYSAEDGLIQAGHVGISLDGKTIYGFHPAEEAIAELERLFAEGKAPSVFDFLKSGGALRGQVYDDTALFQRACDLANNGARTNVWQQSIPISAQDLARIEQAIQQQLAEGSPYPSWYRFPALGGELMPPECNNCATWPRTLGVPLPEGTGQLRDYIELLKALGFPWP